MIYSVNVDIAPDCQRYSPTTKIIYRRQDSTFERRPDNFFEGDPRASAREWMTVIRNDAGDTLLDNWRRNPADWYDPLNEPAPGTPAQAQWLNEWMLEALSIATGYGFKLALFSFPTGSPDYSLWQYLVPALQFGKLNGAILSLHAYNNGGLAEKDENGELTPDAIHNAFRHRYFYNGLPESARIPIVYTEASMGNGFGMQPTPVWINDLIEYGLLVKNDVEVLAACAYQLGGSESNCYQALPDLGDAIIAADWSVTPDVDEWEFDYWD